MAWASKAQQQVKTSVLSFNPFSHDDDDEWGNDAMVDEPASQMNTLSINEKKSTIKEPSSNGGPAIAGFSAQAASFTPKSTGDDEKTDENLVEELSLFKKLLSKSIGLNQPDNQQLEIMRADPNNPLHSVKTFEELNLTDALLKGVRGLGYKYPSHIQEVTLPILMQPKPQNIIAQSQSGTGKTAAFVLTMLSKVDVEKDCCQALLLAPTFELALQIQEVVEEMSRFMDNLKIRLAVKGSPREKVTEQIVIGTPGTVLDFISKVRILNVDQVKVFVLDEADVMISLQGHRDISQRIRNLIRNPTCQYLLFSATYEQEVVEFAEKIIDDPIIIRVKPEEIMLPSIRQFNLITPTVDDKFDAVREIYASVSVGQSIIFCRTKSMVAEVSTKMGDEGFKCAMLSSDLTMEQRVFVINRFREGKERVMIATNVCSRGIDIRQVNLVVNFDLPTDQHRNADYETYVHRIGRTGRFGASGLVLNMIQTEQDVAIMDQIAKQFSIEIQTIDPKQKDGLDILRAP